MHPFYIKDDTQYLARLLDTEVVQYFSPICDVIDECKFVSSELFSPAYAC